MNDMMKNLLLWLVIAVVLISVFSNLGPQRQNVQPMTYSQFLKDVHKGGVSSVTIEKQNIYGKTQGNQTFKTYMPMQDQYLIADLMKNNVAITGKPPAKPSFLMHILINWFPMLLLIAVWIFFMRQMQGGGMGGRGGAMSFGRSRARLLGEDKIKVTFADVAGIDEAKEEVEELVDFLKNPEKFQKPK